ncbi:hypothetical protein [Arthrobacter sp. OAP107]|uniref:hypothetical protein n=1 Tax=Arthrobacter sp. OAP107 TaxID=3156445 RepID=UPI003395BDF8
MEIQCNACKHVETVELCDGYVCPECGSMQGFTMRVVINETLGIHESIRYKGKSEGEKRPYVEVHLGADLHEDSGEFREVTQVVDRRNNLYKKKVVRPIGEVVKDVEGPLIGHDGGSAQRRRPRAADSAAADDQDKDAGDQ